MSLSNNFPTVSPTLNLNFAAAGRLDSRVTFTRSSTATYTNQIGLIQSAAVNEPRFDYDPSTLAARGLLIEEQRTNLVTYSEDFSNAAWNKFNTTISSNAITSPDGTATADKIIESATTSGHYVANLRVAVNGNVYTTSVYLKMAERRYAVLDMTDGLTGGVYVYVDLQTGFITQSVVANGSWTNASATITNSGNGWYRVSVTGTLGANNTAGPLISTSNSPTGGEVPSYTGDGTSGIYLWGAQLEAGSFATSYIKTEAASVTRSADVATVNTLSPWWNASAATFVIENTFGSYYNQPIALSDQAGVGNAWIYAELGVIKSYIAGPNISVSSGVSVAANTYAKSAFSFGADGKAISVNGSTPVVSANTTAPTASTQLSIGGWPGGLYYINGHILRITYYSARLTNAQLQALTL